MGIVRKLKGLLSSNVRHYRGVVLPPAEITPCGRFSDTAEKFYESAVHGAREIEDVFGTSDSTRILDVGCGSGRLAIGLMANETPLARYHGIDVVRARIDWCRRHLTRRDPRFTFEWIDVHNERYNADGRAMDESFRLSADEFDIIYLYSVFTHMTEVDVDRYLAELSRALAPAGEMYVTFFAEEGVPDVTENPANYGELEWKGPLHCVLYSRDRVRDLLDRNGFAVRKIDEKINIDGQSGWHVVRAQ